MSVADNLKYDADGLVPAVVQDVGDGTVLMVGYMNRAAVEQTVATGRVTFWTRSRRRLWVKGETSGHFLHLRELYVDCDADCVLVKAEAAGPTCHEGYRSCFFRQATAGGAGLQTVGEPLEDPDVIYGPR